MAIQPYTPGAAALAIALLAARPASAQGAPPWLAVDSAARTVTTDSPVTLSTIYFDNTASYDVAGPSAITLTPNGATHASSIPWLPISR